jgi:hypothetical protein
MCYINILSKLLDFSRRSAVQFGIRKHVKNTGIPVFTGILMAVYRCSVFAISIHSTLENFFLNTSTCNLHLKLLQALVLASNYKFKCCYMSSHHY